MPKFLQTIDYTGVRQKVQVVASLKQDIPASNQYEPDMAKGIVMSRAPSYSIGSKLPSKHWHSQSK